MSQVSSPNQKLLETFWDIGWSANTRMRNVTGFITQPQAPWNVLGHRNDTQCVSLEMLVPTVRDLGSQMFVTQDTQDSRVLKIYSKRVNCCSFVCTERFLTPTDAIWVCQQWKCFTASKTVTNASLWLSNWKLLERSVTKTCDLPRVSAARRSLKIVQLKRFHQRETTKMS